MTLTFKLHIVLDIIYSQRPSNGAFLIILNSWRPKLAVLLYYSTLLRQDQRFIFLVMSKAYFYSLVRL